MAASELELEPDLNKAPPHLEGHLLKQKSASVLKKGWKKYFFLVFEDHLKYYRKKEDYESGKEPISLMRLSQVKDITEAVFHAVPKKHHLNCGFTLVAFHEKTQQEMTFNLLAETPESKRNWVHGLRYIKSYWSKRKIRETILSEEKEREILERILKEEEDDDDDREVLQSEYWDDPLDSEAATNKSVPITIYFGNGSKVTTKVSPLDTTSDLLESIKDQLTSSSTQLWLIDQSGVDTILESHEHPAGFQAKAHRFYAIDPSQRVLVLFYGDKGQFETITVSSKATAQEIVDHRDVQVQLDIVGINNRGLFLKAENNESLFNSTESPSDALFTLDGNGRVARLSVGQLVVKNKALHGARRTQKLPKVHRAATLISRKTSSEARKMREISEEEEAQQRALSQLQKKRALEQPDQSQSSSRPATVYDEDWVVMPATLEDRRGSEPVPTSRARSSAITSDIESPKNRRKRASLAMSSLTSSPRHTSPRHTSPHHTSPHHTSPQTSPTLSPSRDARGNSRNPRRQLPGIPNEDHQRSSATVDGVQRSPEFGPLKRRNASRKTGANTMGQGPTIKVESEITVAASNRTSHPPNNHVALSRSRSPTIRKTQDPEHNIENGSLLDDTTVDTRLVTPFQSLKPRLLSTADDEDRLDKLFDRTHQIEREERLIVEREVEDSLKSKMVALLSGSGGNGGGVEGGEGEGEGEEEGEKEDFEGAGIKPMVIDISALANRTTPSPLPNVTDPNKTRPQRTTRKPIEVRSPNILKVVMLASETMSSDGGERAMDMLSLSGVVLKCERGVWVLAGGCNFHDPLPFDCQDHTETFVLPGGIRAIFNHSQTPKRWHVLPPPTPAPSVDNCPDENSTEHAQTIAIEDMDSSPAQFNPPPHINRKAIVTEIGAAFLDIVGHFEKTRDMEEKKRIGSDMINNNMGYIIRGRFCSALAALILEGLRPYRIQRLVVNDVWKVTSSFCQEVQSSDASLFMPHELDKLVQIMQAIGSVRELRDNNMKFRTFICLSMSRGLLCKWLQTLPGLRDTLAKFYQPWGFLAQASDQGFNQRLYDNLLQDLEPMNFLPFDLSIDFEIKQHQLAVNQETKNHSRIPTPSSSPHPSPHPSPRPSPRPSPPHTSPPQSPVNSPKITTTSPPPRRLSVTVVKNAATGQRTNNLITAVWQPPEDEPMKDADFEFQMESEGEGRGYTMNSVIEEPDVVSNVEAVNQRESVRETEGDREEERERWREEEWGRREGERGRGWDGERWREGDGGREGEGERGRETRGGGGGKAMSWFRKLANNLQQISAGGTNTGPYPPQPYPPQPPPPPPTHPDKRYVQALYTNVAEDRDELAFSKGDILSVTGQINEDWLICSFGPLTGIVPANFVQEIKI